MSPEERQLLQGLFDRMRSNATAPRDKEAEQMIADAVRQQPYAPYLLAQTVIVQDQALQAANDKLQQLEQQLQDQQQGQSGGFLSGIFGGSPSRQTPPPPPPAPSRPVWNQGGTLQGGAYPQQGGGYPPPPPQGGPWGGAQPMGGGGGGFLQGALGTAAGVAGGVLMAESIRSLFTGSHAAASGLGIAQGVPGIGGGGNVTNNYYGDSGASSADGRQDAAQDANEDWGGSSQSGPSAADFQQDADQDQDFAQDMDGYDDV